MTYFLNSFTCCVVIHFTAQHVSESILKTRKPRKGAAVIAASMHGFASCQKFKSPVTLTLTLDRVKVKSTYTYSTCRSTCRPNHVTVALHSTEIWPFEFRQISILDEVWTLVIAFLDGNSKIWLRQAVVQVPYYGHQPSVLSSTPKWRRR